MPDEPAMPRPAPPVAIAAAPSAAPSHAASPARRRLLSLGALGIAAIAAAKLPSPVNADGLGWDDQQGLRFLEEVEALQANFFVLSAFSPTFAAMPGRERDVISLIAYQDQQQNDWFRLARQKFGVAEFGHFYAPNTSTSRPPRLFDFPNSVFDRREEYVPFAISLKEASVDAYQGVIAKADRPEVVQAIAQLAGIESRHAAALRELAGDQPLSAVEDALRPVEVFRKWEDYGFKGESLR
jgi:hypothetical protein